MTGPWRATATHRKRHDAPSKCQIMSTVLTLSAPYMLFVASVEPRSQAEEALDGVVVSRWPRVPFGNAAIISHYPLPADGLFWN